MATAGDFRAGNPPDEWAAWTDEAERAFAQAVADTAARMAVHGKADAIAEAVRDAYEDIPGMAETIAIDALPDEAQLPATITAAHVAAAAKEVAYDYTPPAQAGA